MLDIHNDIIRFCQHTSKELSKFIQTDSKLTFSRIKLSNGNLYIVDLSTIHLVKGKISSYSLKPVGLILESDNGEYRYYNFDEDYEDVEKIVKEFVLQCLI